MLVFLDTEFTGLAQHDPKLISLALVPADGRSESSTEIAICAGPERIVSNPRGYVGQDPVTVFNPALVVEV